MPSAQNIIIAGAGIGGLAAAANLIKAGHRVRVYEQAPELGEVGAGIQMSANGVKVLQSLGLGDKLEEIGVKPDAYVFRLYHSGEVLQQFPLGAQHEEINGAPYYQLHRADIHAALADKVQDLDPAAIHLGCTVTGYEEYADSVSVNFADGSSESCDLLVGADGIKSAVRTQILGETPANFTGQSAWRILIPTDRLPEGLVDKVMTVWVGPGKHAVVYYVRGGEMINFVGCVDSPDWTDDSWLAKADWQDMKSDFADWHEEVTTILDAADRDTCFRWALNNRIPVDNWSTERVTLLGDSCHATLPYMAQGAVMAVEDGAILSRALEETESVADALQIYQTHRIPRTAKIVGESSDNAKLFHLPSEDALRDAFAKREMGRERNSWLYSYDALTVPLDS